MSKKNPIDDEEDNINPDAKHQKKSYDKVKMTYDDINSVLNREISSFLDVNSEN